MKPTYFKTPADFRKWLEKNHEKETELIVGFYKKSTKKPSITWPESVQQALCFGWIDGIRRKVDYESYSIRFTPRNPKSLWSRVNLKYMEELLEKGLVHQVGKEKFENRPAQDEAIASFEAGKVELPKDFIKEFKTHKKAWENFNSMAPSYQKGAKWWVISAKQDETKQRRLSHLIECSEEKIAVKPLRRRDGK